MTTGVGVQGDRKSAVASVGGGLSIAVGPWQLIAADRKLAAEALGGDPPTELLLLPSPVWVLEDITLNTPKAALELVVAEIGERGIDIHCDYHHQSLYAAKTGIQAPAAGWAPYSGFRIDGQGLWATGIRWTATADSYLRKGEYRYFSPVVYFEDKTLIVTSLDSWALTNTPRTNDQPPLTAALAAARFESRRLAASMGGTMEKWVSILINFLDSLWCHSPDELLGHIDKARAKFVEVMAEGADPAAASSEFAKSLPKNATILQALIAGGLEIPEGVVQLAAAKIAAESDDVPENLLTIVGMEKGTKRAAFAAALVGLMTERVPRSELDAARAEIAAARVNDEKTKVDSLLVKFADRFNESEAPELRRIAASSPENFAAIEANLSKRQPVVRVSASRETAPPAPQLKAAGARTMQIAGETRSVTEDGAANHEATMAILAEKEWPVSRYNEANDLRKAAERAAANKAAAV
jgi:phage I-like protein